MLQPQLYTAQGYLGKGKSATQQLALSDEHLTAQPNINHTLLASLPLHHEHV